MGGNHYRLMAISDTHLGEDCSLLSFPQGRWHLWETLRQKLGNGKKFTVDELILVGDIPDRCLSSTAQIITHTNDFTEMLGSVATIKKGIYLIGNHDHSIWTNYRARRFGAGLEYGVSPPEGFALIGAGDLVPDESEREIVTLLFGYDKGSSWRAIIKRANPPKITVAYPLYMKVLKKRAYVFSHGVHFCRITQWLDSLNDAPGEIFRRAKEMLETFFSRNQSNSTLEELEVDLGPTIDAVWPCSRNEPTPWIDKVYYVLCKLTGKFESKRPVPPESEMFLWDDLPTVDRKRIAQLTDAAHRPTNDSTERFITDFWPIVRASVQDQLHEMPVTFVHGHTHYGGWGKLLDDGREVRIYDLGGWVVHNKHHHPGCHIFLVDHDYREWLLDVSFQDVKIDEESLLDLAQRDAENRP